MPPTISPNHGVNPVGTGVITNNIKAKNNTITTTPAAKDRNSGVFCNFLSLPNRSTAKNMGICMICITKIKPITSTITSENALNIIPIPNKIEIMR